MHVETYSIISDTNVNLATHYANTSEISKGVKNITGLAAIFHGVVRGYQGVENDIAVTFTSVLTTQQKSDLDSFFTSYEGTLIVVDDAQHVVVNNSVSLEDFSGLDDVKHRSRFKGLYLPGLSGEDTTIYSVSFPYPVSLAYGEILGENVQSGDYACAYAETKPLNGNPAGLVSGVVANAALDALTVDVATLPLELYPGDVVRLGTEAYDYYVANHESISETVDRITLYEGLNVAKTAGDSVFYRGLSCDLIYLTPDRKVDFGRNTFGSMLLPPTMQITIEYHHVSTLAADTNIPIIFGYFYGKLKT